VQTHPFNNVLSLTAGTAAIPKRATPYNQPGLLHRFHRFTQMNSCGALSPLDMRTIYDRPERMQRVTPGTRSRAKSRADGSSCIQIRTRSVTPASMNRPQTAAAAARDAASQKPPGARRRRRVRLFVPPDPAQGPGLFPAGGAHPGRTAGRCVAGSAHGDIADHSTRNVRHDRPRGTATLHHEGHAGHEVI